MTFLQCGYLDRLFEGWPMLKHVKVHCEIDNDTLPRYGLAQKDYMLLNVWQALVRGFQEKNRHVVVEIAVHRLLWEVYVDTCTENTGA
jgi:hypothetical protein